jgi:hypothetical protein
VAVPRTLVQGYFTCEWTFGLPCGLRRVLTPGSADSSPQVKHSQESAWSNHFTPCTLLSFAAGWSSLVARRAHNPKVVGSNPTPATIESLVGASRA